MADDEPVMKGGHAPAEKIAGGVRIARKARTPSESEKAASNGVEKAESETNEETSESREVTEAKNVLAHTGLAAQTRKDYPAEAVRAYHEKPLPQHHNPQSKPQPFVFQPAKQ